jgi:hypothetical protein
MLEKNKNACIKIMPRVAEGNAIADAILLVPIP